MLSVTTEKPIQANICEVKKSERGDIFKKKLSWALRELRFVDARYSQNKASGALRRTKEYI